MDAHDLEMPGPFCSGKPLVLAGLHGKEGCRGREAARVELPANRLFLERLRAASHGQVLVCRASRARQVHVRPVICAWLRLVIPSALGT